MIISRTPLRVSFVGGGTDLESYYRSGHGAVVSTAIQQYMYVAVNRKFDRQIRISYSETEMVATVDDVRHELVRESMKLTGATEGVEIVTIADIPSRGTGLGSSSSLTVGLLNSLHAFQGRHSSAKRLAEEACRIEIETLGSPIGKQDQYAAAYGGLNYLQFDADGSVRVDPLLCTRSVKDDLESSLLMFYTGQTRQANGILAEQRARAGDGQSTKYLDQMRDQAAAVRDFLRAGDLTRFGEALHEGWLMKRHLASGITTPDIDRWYAAGLKAGALGGKLLGAGGGGFLLFFVPHERQTQVRGALADLRECPFKFDPQGSKIIYIEDWR